MEHINGVGYSSGIDHPPFSEDANANFSNTRTRSLGIGFRVRWFKSSLNGKQLKARLTAGLGWKITEIVETGTQELQRLHPRNYTTTELER